MLPFIAKPEESDLMTEEEKKARPNKVSFNKSIIVDLLKSNIVTVVFTKVDGTERTMKCTLKEDILPKSDISRLVEEQTNARKQNDNVIAVWDVDNNGWRSFRLDTVQQIHEYVPVELTTHD